MRQHARLFSFFCLRHAGENSRLPHYIIYSSLLGVFYTSTLLPFVSSLLPFGRGWQGSKGLVAWYAGRGVAVLQKQGPEKKVSNLCSLFQVYPIFIFPTCRRSNAQMIPIPFNTITPLYPIPLFQAEIIANCSFWGFAFQALALFTYGPSWSSKA